MLVIHVAELAAAKLSGPTFTMGIFPAARHLTGIFHHHGHSGVRHLFNNTVPF
jgi:hypothetical protein